MQERFEDESAPKTLTEEEVTLVIERYGEMQAAKRGPSVDDVAEAMGVDADVVEKILGEIRQSKSDEEVKKRLDALEEENARLREMSVATHSYQTAGRRTRALPFLVVAAIIIALLTIRGIGSGGGVGIAPIIVFGLLLGLVIRALRRG